MYEHRDDIQPAATGADVDVVRRRLLWGLWAAVILTVLAAIPGILLDRGGDTKKVTSAQPFLPVTTTTTVPAPLAGAASPAVPAPTTTVAKGVVNAIQAAPSPATTTTARAAPAPAKICRNSYDPACGPFRWDPDPGPNQPLRVTVTPPSQQVKAGDEVNFHIVAEDPDARIDRCVVMEFGDGQTGGSCPPSAACPTPYGPWTPPAKAADRYELDVKHKYTSPPPQQPYVASFRAQSHSFCNPDPYGGSAVGSATVTVS
jgi:hypothetical protein